MNAGPQRASRAALAVSLLSVCLLDYGNYREAFRATPDAWMDVARGTASAPQQYRVGVVRAAVWMTGHSALRLQHAFGLMDAIAVLVAGFVLLRVLERSGVYRRAAVMAQWMGGLGFVGLVTFYLLWAVTAQRPETLPAAMLVALMLWLWQRGERASAGKSFGIAAGLLVLTAVLGLVRADVAFFLNLGVLVAALTALGKGFSLRREWAVCVSLVGATIAAGMQLYLMKVAYPQANYGRVKMWQLRPNLMHATRWPGFVLFLIPVVWTAWWVWRRRFAEDAASVALLLGAGMYLCVWVVLGKVDEVRIFLPWALALAPLTMEMVMLRAGGSGAGGREADAGRSAA